MHIASHKAVVNPAGPPMVNISSESTNIDGGGCCMQETFGTLLESTAGVALVWG